MHVQVVSHVWNYWRLAIYHLSAYVLNPPVDNTVMVTICYTPEDDGARPVLDYFGAIEVPNVIWCWHPMEQSRLMRRAIGRHEICKVTQADYLLFSDIDYVIGGTQIDAAVHEMQQYDTPRLWYPERLLQSKDHAHGDAEIERVTTVGVYDVEPSRYTVIPLDRSIGGCQWLRGDFARDKGYLPEGHKFLRPERLWRRTFEDARSRGYWGLPMQPLKVQGVRRIRHSKAGRFESGLKL